MGKQVTRSFPSLQFPNSREQIPLLVGVRTTGKGFWGTFSSWSLIMNTMSPSSRVIQRRNGSALSAMVRSPVKTSSVCLDGHVPVLNERLVHLRERVERSIAVLDSVRVPKVRIREAYIADFWVGLSECLVRLTVQNCSIRVIVVLFELIHYSSFSSAVLRFLECLDG